jgi:hypothetical protein
MQLRPEHCSLNSVGHIGKPNHCHLKLFVLVCGNGLCIAKKCVCVCVCTRYMKCEWMRGFVSVGCVCVWEREREREREVCRCARVNMWWACLGVSECMKSEKYVSLCGWVHMCVCMSVCVTACEWCLSACVYVSRWILYQSKVCLWLWVFVCGGMCGCMGWDDVW